MASSFTDEGQATSDSLRKLLIELENYRRRLETALLSKVQLEREIRETENALEETNKLTDEKNVYKLTGYILVKRKREEIINELNDRVMVLKTRHRENEELIKRLQSRIKRTEREIIEEQRKLRTPKAL